MSETPHPSGWHYTDLIDRFVEQGLVQPTEWRGVPLLRTPLPPKVPGAYFDEAAVERVLRFFLLLKQIVGRWAGRTFMLFDWQVEFFFAPVFGWKGPGGCRIIRTVWFEEPRKNGKTTISAGIGLYLLSADREPGAEVYAAAGDRNQATLVFRPAKLMVQGSPKLKKRLRPLRNLIENAKTNSIFRVLSSEGDRQHGLNVHGAVIDEVHVHKSRDLIDALETGTGSRDQPLIVFITTADAGDETTIYAEKRTYVEKVCSGLIDDPSFYGVVFGIDAREYEEGRVDPFAVATIERANPGIDLTVNRSYLLGKAKEAQTSPGALNRFLRLHLGIRTRSVTRWLDERIYNESAGMVIEEQLHGRDCYGGLDLASTGDFNAWALVFPAPEPEPWDVLVRLWVPRAALNHRQNLAPILNTWAREGFINVTDGDIQDQRSIREQMERDATDFNLVEVAYDPWNSGFMPELVEAGMDAWPMQQTVMRLNPPTKYVERLIGQRRFRHGGNPVLRWMFANVALYVDSGGNIKPDKRKSHEKIDGVSAVVNAVGAAIREREAETVPEIHLLS